MSDPLNPPRTIVAKSGDPVPPSTSGKMWGGGTGGSAGGALGVVIGYMITQQFPEMPSEIVAATVILVTGGLAWAGGAIGAYRARNYLK